MRTLNAIMLTITGLALGVACYLHPTPWNVLLSLALLGTLVALASFVSGHAASYVVLAAAAGAAYATGASFGAGPLWLDDGPAAMLGLLTMAAVIVVFWRLKSRVRRVYKSDLLILTGKLMPSMRIVTGPEHVLPLFQKVLAVMPNNEQERTLTIEHVNVRPQPGPLGGVAQNINRVELELVYQVDPQAVMGAFGVHNRDDFFKEGADAVGKRMPAAMAEKLFWVKIWELALADIAERHLRLAVHRSGMSAMGVSERRDEIEAMIVEPIGEEARKIGLTLLECNIHNVEPDEAVAALEGREALLKALARAKEIELTGVAQAGARAAQVHAMVEAVKAAGGQVPQRIVELIIHGVLPHTVLSAYVPGYNPGDPLVSGGPFRN